jgi:hypothetical protein
MRIIFAIVIWIGCSQGIALAPSTFGGVVASAGRLTNSIRVSNKVIVKKISKIIEFHCQKAEIC